MHTETVVPTRSELYVPDLDNDVVIENSVAGVVIRTTHDNFSERRKRAFIRHLAAEGYISDRYEWFSEPSEEGFFGVKWVACGCTSSRGRISRFLRRHCTRRNAFYGSLFVFWLLCCIWAARHNPHGLGL
jgi:hypothetical protein